MPSTVHVVESSPATNVSAALLPTTGVSISDSSLPKAPVVSDCAIVIDDAEPSAKQPRTTRSSAGRGRARATTTGGRPHHTRRQTGTKRPHPSVDKKLEQEDETEDVDVISVDKTVRTLDGLEDTISRIQFYLSTGQFDCHVHSVQHFNRLTVDDKICDQFNDVETCTSSFIQQ